LFPQVSGSLRRDTSPPKRRARATEQSALGTLREASKINFEPCQLCRQLWARQRRRSEPCQRVAGDCDTCAGWPDASDCNVRSLRRAEGWWAGPDGRRYSCSPSTTSDAACRSNSSRYLLNAGIASSFPGYNQV